MKSLRSLDYFLAGLLFSIFLGFYLSFPTRSYVLEGLARAIPMELGIFSRLLLGNYLLYGLVGNLFYHLLMAAGFSGHAYVALQAMDSVIGAAGLFLFFLTLRTAGTNRYFSFVWTLVLAVSLGYSMWSTEAENYILSTFLLALHFFFLLLYYRTRRIPIVFLGLLEAFAIFGHLVNALFILVAVWFFWKTDAIRWKKSRLIYAMTALGTVIIVFGLALSILKPAGMLEAWSWILGSAAGAHGSIRWHGSGVTLQGLHDWVKMSVRVIGSLSEQPFAHPPAWPYARFFLWAARVLFIGYALQSMRSIRKLSHEQKTILGGCVLWLGLYALVFTSWEPNTMVYRVSDLIPFITILSLFSNESVIWPGQRSVVLGIALGLAAGNIGAEIYPRSFWENNRKWVAMQTLKTATEPTAWIAGNEGSDNIYIAYFAERRPLVLSNYRDRLDQLQAILSGIESRHEPLYITPQMLADPFWNPFFHAYTKRPVGGGSPPLLYNLTRILAG